MRLTEDTALHHRNLDAAPTLLELVGDNRSLFDVETFRHLDGVTVRLAVERDGAAASANAHVEQRHLTGDLDAEGVALRADALRKQLAVQAAPRLGTEFLPFLASPAGGLSPLADLACDLHLRATLFLFQARGAATSSIRISVEHLVILP